MDFRLYKEYVVTVLLPAGDNGVVMGVHQSDGSFATWETAGGEYKAPHYFTDIDEAVEDLCLRALGELRRKKQPQEISKGRGR